MCCLNFVAKVLAMACGLLFIILIPLALWSLTFTRVGLQEETYLEPFQTEGFYENLVPLVLPAMAESSQNNPNTPQDDIMLPGKLRFRDVVNNLEQDDWNAIAEEIVPPDYIKTEIESNWSAFLDYAQGEEPRLNIVWDASIVRNNLLGEPGDRMVNRIFNTWPTCEAASEQMIQDFIDEKTEEFPYCKPSDPTLQRETFALLTASKDDLANDLPETFNVREEVAKQNNVSIQEADQILYRDVQRPMALSLALSPLTILLPCALLALIVILAVSSSKTFFAWLGWPVALAGITTLLPIAIVPFILASLSTPAGSDVDAFQGEALRNVGRALVVSFTRPILVQGALMVAVGFISMLIAALMPDPDEDLYYAPEGSTARMHTPPPSTPMNQSSMVAPIVTPPPRPTPPPAPSHPSNFGLDLPEPTWPEGKPKNEDKQPRRIKVQIDVEKPSKKR